MLFSCCLAALASPPDTHTHAKTHTHSPLLCIPLLLLCPELTVHSQQNHSSYTQPAGSSAIPLSHTLTSSLLAALLFLLPFLLSLSILLSHPLSQTHTHTHTLSQFLSHCYQQTVPSLPLLTVLTERSFFQKGYFTMRLWLIRGGVEVEDEAVEEEEAGGMRWER